MEEKLNIEAITSEITEIKMPPPEPGDITGGPATEEIKTPPPPADDFSGDFDGGKVPEADVIPGDDEAIHGDELEDLGDIVVEGIDMLGQLGAKFAYQRTAFTDQQRQHLNELLDETQYRSENNLPRVTATAYEKYIARRGKEMDDYLKKQVPITPKERERFSRRLKKVVGSMNFKVTPGGALIATVLIYVFSRIIPILANILEGRQAPPAEFSERSSKTSRAA